MRLIRLLIAVLAFAALTFGVMAQTKDGLGGSGDMASATDTSTPNPWFNVPGLDVTGSLQAFYHVTAGLSINTEITPLAYSLGNHQDLRDDWQEENPNKTLQNDEIAYNKNKTMIRHTVTWTSVNTANQSQ